MHYYVPARIFLTGDLSPTHLVILTGAAAVLWTLSLRVWSSRYVLTTSPPRAPQNERKV